MSTRKDYRVFNYLARYRLSRPLRHDLFYGSPLGATEERKRLVFQNLAENRVY